MFEWIKRKAIELTDFVNRQYDPFEEFTRPAQNKSGKPLEVKCQEFEKNMDENFILPTGIWNYKKMGDGGIDMGDQCIWHGIYTAMWAFRRNVLGDGTNGEPLLRLYYSVKAMEKHYRQTNDGKYGYLIRGIGNDGQFQEDASNDSLTGHLAGLYFAHKYGDEDVKQQCRKMILTLGRSVLDHKHCLINADRKETTHGRLINGILTDPLRASECMALYLTAWHITGKGEFFTAYNDLFKKYRGIVEFPKVRLLWWDTRYDSHRAMLHLVMLYELSEDNDLESDLYLKGIQRIYEMERKSGNVWIMYLYGRNFKMSMPDRMVCAKVLSEFELEEKFNVVERINSNNPDIKKVKWGNETLATQPLPRWKSGSQDFYWQRNLYNLDQWQGIKTPQFYHNGADFLICYYLGKMQGYF